MRVGSDLVEVPFGGLPPIITMFKSDRPPGILIGARPDEEFPVYGTTLVPPDWNAALLAKFGGEEELQIPGRLHVGFLGQTVAKTAHAYAVACLGESMAPFLTDYIRERSPGLPSYYIAALPNAHPSDALHEIRLARSLAPRNTVIGPVQDKVYVVELRLFASLGAPEFLVVVGRAR